MSSSQKEAVSLRPVCDDGDGDDGHEHGGDGDDPGGLVCCV